MTVTFFNETSQISVPSWVVDLASFRRWVESEGFPDKERVCFVGGEVLVDMGKEQLFSHVLLKTEYAAVLHGLVKASKKGKFFTDGAYVTNEAADLSVKPDGIFIANESFRLRKVELVEGAESGFVEVAGSPDMVLEIVSDSSETKDTEVLFDAYWRAGVREYWLVDARTTSARFDVYKRGADGFVAVRKQGGWLKSPVFGRGFRLTVSADDLGHPEYLLEVRGS